MHIAGYGFLLDGEGLVCLELLLHEHCPDVLASLAVVKDSGVRVLDLPSAPLRRRSHDLRCCCFCDTADEVM